MNDFRELGKCRKSENHSHFNTEANQALCLQILDDVLNLSEVELEKQHQDALARYSEHPEMLVRDLANLQAIFGGAE